MLILLPRIPSLNSLDWADSYLYFRTIQRFPVTQTSCPGGGVGPAAAVLRCQRQGCSSNSCEAWFSVAAGNDSQGVGRQEGLDVTLCTKCECQEKEPGVWTGKTGLLLSSSCRI